MPTRFFFNGKKDFGEKQLKADAKRVLQKYGNKSRDLIFKPTETWDHGIAVKVDVKTESVETYTEDYVYGILEDGTPPHEIRGNPTLAFQENFVSKTLPNTLQSRPGGKSGNYVYPPPAVVHHPGTEARNWMHQIINQLEAPFQNEIEKEVGKNL